MVELANTDAQERSVFIIAAPGGRAFGKDLVSGLVSDLRSTQTVTSVVGDGEHTMLLEDVTASLQKHASAARNGTIVFVLAHGDNIGGEHRINLNGEFETKTADLLKGVSSQSNGRTLDRVPWRGCAKRC